MAEEEFPDALPPGHRLHWYVLERVLGQGGFGITYLARDTNLERLVAIKEYLPAEVARRRSDASARPSTESHAERFAWGLDRFLSEARTLARFEHPNIVRVLSIFEANGTAYMVMRFEEGEDLGTLLRRRGTLPQSELVGVLLPVLAGLQLIHSSGFIHRDIKPENIYIREDGSPVLLDFGSARQSFGGTKTMTILVAPGYAPLEQYYGDAKTQGPWTDIYGLAATCYRAATGRAPLDAIARAKGVLGSTRDMLEPVSSLAEGRYDAKLLSAIDHALQLSERDRPQSVAEWRREIESPIVPVAVDRDLPAQRAMVPHPDSAATTRGAEAAPTLRPPRAGASSHDSAHRGLLSRLEPRWIVAAVVCAAVAAALGLYFKPLKPQEGTVAVAPQPSPLAGKATSAPAIPPATAVASEAIKNIAAADAVPATIPTARLSPEAGRTEPAVVPRVVPPPDHKLAVSEVGAKEPKSLQRNTAVASTAVPPSITAAPDTGTRSTTRAAEALPRSPVETSATTSSPPPGALPLPVQTASGPAQITVAAAAPPKAPSSRRRDEQLDAAEAALRRGDTASAVQIAMPWASAGVTRAQTLLGRAQEARSKEQHSDFEAYVWYGIAARNGEASAQTLKDKVAGHLQPAEIRQAEQIIEHWKPAGEGPP